MSKRYKEFIRKVERLMLYGRTKEEIHNQSLGKLKPESQVRKARFLVLKEKTLKELQRLNPDTEE